jgi:Polysaccharide biosynthesis enzyme WcbI
MMAMTPQKILVIGNCQARPVTKLMQSTGSFDCLPPILLQLSRPEDAAQHQALIDAADIVFAQLTVDTFEPAHLRSSQIKARYPDKTVIWPNMFYSGQQPYLRYMTHLTEGRILGPLEALHDIRIFRKWLLQRGKGQQADWVEGPDFVARAGAASLQGLKSRELRCDVHVSDLIQDATEGKRLFFTFNHPNNWLLARTSERMLGQLGASYVIDEKSDPEYLSRYIVPSVWSGNADYPEPFRGVNTILKSNKTVGAEGLREYTLSELEDAFMSCYDHLDSLMVKEKVRFTPDFGEVF